MTKIDIKQLQSIGLNKNEAIVFFSLIKLKETDVKQILKDTQLHRNLVYENLEKLIQKGFVSFIIKNKKKFFTLAKSDSLINFLEKEQNELNERKEIAKGLAKEIDAIPREKVKTQTATIFEGTKALKNYLKETLEKGNYVSFGAPCNSLEIIDELFWKNYNLKMKKNQIFAKMIFNSSLKEYGEKIKSENITLKFLEKDFEPMTQTIVQNDEIAIIVWKKEPVLFFIQDSFVAHSYKKYFNMLWKNSKI